MSDILYSTLFGLDNESQVAIVDPGTGGSTAWDASVGQVATAAFTTVAPGETRTLSNPTNLVAGRKYTVIVVCAGTDPVAVTYGTLYTDTRNNRLNQNVLTLHPGRTKTLEFQFDGTTLRSTTQTDRTVQTVAAGPALLTADSVGAYVAVDMNAAGTVTRLPHPVTDGLTVGDEVVIYNQGAFGGQLGLQGAATILGGTTLPPGRTVTATYVAVNTWAVSGAEYTQDSVADIVFPEALAPALGTGSISRAASPWGDGHVVHMDDTSLVNTTQYKGALQGLTFAAGDTYQIRIKVAADTVNLNHTLGIGYLDDGVNAVVRIAEIGTVGGAAVAGGNAFGNATGNITVTTLDRGVTRLYQIDMVLAWSGPSGANPVLSIQPAYNLDGTATANGAVLGSVDVLSVEVGAVLEFASGGGLTKKGVVTADPAPASEGIYTLDASAAAFTFTLPVSTGSQSRVLLIADNVVVNAVTLAVPVGESMNATTNGTFTASTNGQILLAVDRALGVWEVQVVGGGALVGLTSAALYMTGNSAGGAADFTAASTLGAGTPWTNADANGIAANTNGQLAIVKAGRYAVSMGFHFPAAGSTATFELRVNNLPVRTYYVEGGTTAGDDVSMSGEAELLLAPNDVVTFYCATTAFSSNRMAAGAYFRVVELPAETQVLAGMVVPTPLATVMASRNTTVNPGGGAFAPWDSVDINDQGLTETLGTTGLVTLKAGKRYTISAGVRVISGATGFATWELRTQGGTVLPGGYIHTESSGLASSNTAMSSVTLSYMPLVDTQVGLHLGTPSNVGEISDGSYLLIEEQPTSTVVDPGAVLVNDQAASGYFVIGTMMQAWGTGVAGTPIVFPVAFSVAPVVTLTIEGFSSDRTVAVGVPSTTGVGVTSWNTGTNAASSGETIYWMAAGLA